VGDRRALAAGPAPPRPPYGGRHRTISDRACLAAIIYMARTSTPWRLLPAREFGCGSPATCWRRLTEWANAGVFDALHLQVLDRLGEAPPAGLVAGERGHHERAGQARGTRWAQIPVDLGKPGTKLHLVCDDGGVPLSVVVTAANVNDTTMFQAVMADIPPIRTPAGRRRTRPAKMHADKGYDSRANRAYLRRRGIKARIARREVESSTRLGRHRWKVERSLSWLSCFRRLQVRWDRDAGRWFAFVLVACAMVCFNRL
jgi:transposase